jgi:hypothetical protein
MFRNKSIPSDHTVNARIKKRPPAQTGGRKSAAENRKDKSCHGQTLCKQRHKANRRLAQTNHSVSLSIRLDDLSQAYVQNHYVNALRSRCDLTETVYHNKRNKSNARSTRKGCIFYTQNRK